MSIVNRSEIYTFYNGKLVLMIQCQNNQWKDFQRSAIDPDKKLSRHNLLSNCFIIITNQKIILNAIQ